MVATSKLIAGERIQTQLRVIPNPDKLIKT